MANVAEMIETIKGMTVVELNDLVKALQEEFGVSAMPVAAAAAPAGAAADAAPVEEKTSFDAILTAIGEKKINVIKAVREITGLGLKEAKDLVESAPHAIKEGIGEADAKAIKEKVEAEGGSVEIK